MKKKPSLQGVINRSKRHSYQQSVSTSDLLTSQVAPVTVQPSSNKVIESVYKSYLYIFLKKHFFFF